MNARGAIVEELPLLNDTWLELMRDGRFAEAWRISDRAVETRRGVDCSSWPRHLQFLWNGEPLDGKRVLVRCYHGLGDTIQFVRFAPLARSVAREIILWAQPVLVPLVETVEGVDRVLPLHEGAPDVDFDVDIEICELMHALRVTPESIPNIVPYFDIEAPNPGRGACGFHVRSRESKGSARRVVGLVWQSGDWDPRRSVPCEDLRRLGDLPGIEWRLFQRGPALAGWRNGFGTAPRVSGILEEARAMRELDLLISVDTCSAHLAGALGVPVWTLLPAEADWRWMRGRDDTPWYPTMRLFRQSRPGDWEPTVRRIESALRRWLVPAARA